jgi:hypothetical protein
MGLHIASPWHAKAKEMLVGRKNIFLQIKQDKNPKTLWMHCASVGEYEQGLPIITLWKQKHPQSIVVLTFFSPSGYHAFKANDIVDEMYYLPLDSKSNAAQFVDAINPSIAIFVKYELWYYYLAALHARKIPTYMVSMYVAKNNIFQKYYGALHRTMLHFFTCIFVQDDNSKAILYSLGLRQVIVTGDTRFDRMKAIAAAPFEDTVINDFCGDKKILIAGSTWPADEKLLVEPTASEIKEAEKLPYPNLLGVVQYPSNYTKLEMKYSMSVLSRHRTKWGINHFKILIKALEYGWSTRKFGLKYARANEQKERNKLVAYADSSFTLPRSQGCRLILMNGAAICFTSKRHTTTDDSTTAAELTELYLAACEVEAMRNLNSEIGLEQDGPTTIFQDNQAAIQIAMNRGSLSRKTRATETRTLTVRNKVEDLKVVPIYIKTTDMIADIGTKALDPKLFISLRDRLCGYFYQSTN